MLLPNHLSSSNHFFIAAVVSFAQSENQNHFLPLTYLFSIVQSHVLISSKNMYLQARVRVF